MVKAILKVETVDASDPSANHEELVLADELAERLPQFKGIIDHRDFYKLEYIVDVHRVRITYQYDEEEAENA